MKQAWRLRQRERETRADSLNSHNCNCSGAQRGLLFPIFWYCFQLCVFSLCDCLFSKCAQKAGGWKARSRAAAAGRIIRKKGAHTHKRRIVNKSAGLQNGEWVTHANALSGSIFHRACDAETEPDCCRDYHLCEWVCDMSKARRRSPLFRHTWRSRSRLAEARSRTCLFARAEKWCHYWLAQTKQLSRLR
jgi:hypothetical protein